MARAIATNTEADVTITNDDSLLGAPSQIIKNSYSGNHE